MTQPHPTRTGAPVNGPCGLTVTGRPWPMVDGRPWVPPIRARTPGERAAMRERAHRRTIDAAEGPAGSLCAAARVVAGQMGTRRRSMRRVVESLAFRREHMIETGRVLVDAMGQPVGQRRPIEYRARRRIADAVASDRKRWASREEQGGSWHRDPAAEHEKAVRRGVQSGIARRSRTESRDAQILDLSAGGTSGRGIARACGCSYGSVLNVLRRERERKRKALSERVHHERTVGTPVHVGAARAGALSTHAKRRPVPTGGRPSADHPEPPAARVAAPALSSPGGGLTGERPPLPPRRRPAGQGHEPAEPRPSGSPRRAAEPRPSGPPRRAARPAQNVQQGKPFDLPASIRQKPRLLKAVLSLRKSLEAASEEEPPP